MEPILRAIDTNILVRLITVDDPSQYHAAVDVIAHDVVLPITVILETSWVLSSHYGMSRESIGSALDALLDFPTIHVVDEAGLRWALGRYAAGADLADMIHLVAAGEASAFLTFDRKLAAAAGAKPPLPVETLKIS